MMEKSKYAAMSNAFHAAKNLAKETPSGGSERRLVLLAADESLLAIKWARDHAEELEKFHRREGEYYKELPRSADDHAMAESYARMKRALTAILEQNARGDARRADARTQQGG